jgi:hypothetical protein
VSNVLDIAGFTVIVPDNAVGPQPPVNGMKYVKVPAALGVPLMLIIPAVASPVNVALNPGGKPVAKPIPVAPVVLWVMNGDSKTFIHAGVVVPEEAVFKGVIITVAVEFEQLPPPGTVYV